MKDVTENSLSWGIWIVFNSVYWKNGTRKQHALCKWLFIQRLKERVIYPWKCAHINVSRKLPGLKSIEQRTEGYSLFLRDLVKESFSILGEVMGIDLGSCSTALTAPLLPFSWSTLSLINVSTCNEPDEWQIYETLPWRITKGLRDKTNICPNSYPV